MMVKLQSHRKSYATTGNENMRWQLFRCGRPTNKSLNMTANYVASFGNAYRAAGQL